MSLLRDPNQTALADLHAFGAGILHRYEALLEIDLDPSLQDVLSGIRGNRSSLVEELAAAVATRGDQPKAADQEINEMRSLIDRLLGIQFGTESIGRRVMQTEQEWASHLDRAMDLQWRDQELDLLHRLKADVATTMDRLSALVDGVD
jgi:hypothetical protein